MKKRPISAPSITRKWRRVMAIGCSHGNRANPQALEAVLRFKDRWRPEIAFHLGDAYDLASLRAGAMGNSDNEDAYDDWNADIEAGRDFLSKYEPDVFCFGNHDERALKFATHPKAIIRGFATELVKKMEEPLRKKGCKVIEEYSVHNAAWYPLGGFLFGHGIIYSENAARDSAERWGNVVCAHNHRVGMAKGRRADNPTCYTVGTLADVPAMGYAERRPSTLAWSHGVLWGEAADDKAQFQLTEWPQGETEWRLPI